MNTWMDCINAVNAMSKDYRSVIREMNEKFPNRIKRKSSEKGDVIDIAMPTQCGYEVSLIVKVNKTKGNEDAKYYAWNDQENKCYQRNLVVDIFETDIFS